MGLLKKTQRVVTLLAVKIKEDHEEPLTDDVGFIVYHIYQEKSILDFYFTVQEN